MSAFDTQSPFSNRRVSHFATPTRRSSPFATADAELSAITAGCADRGRCRDVPSARCDVRTSNCTPVRAAAEDVSAAHKQRGATSPVTVRAAVRQMAVSPRCRRCTGPAFAEVDVLCGSPRVHLALPPFRCGHGRKASQFGELNCALVLQDSHADFHVVKSPLPDLEDRSASEPKTTASSLSMTPTEPNIASPTSKHPFLCIASESLAVEEGNSSVNSTKSLRSPNSPSFSFFAAVSEKRNSRGLAMKLDSARNAGEQPSVVSPPYSAPRPGQSPWNDTTAASLSSSALPAEVNVFSPLRFDSRAAPSMQSQGLSSVSPSHHSSMRLLPPPGCSSQWHLEDGRDIWAPDVGASQDHARDAVMQQRLLHAFLAVLTRETAEQESEAQCLRWRRLSGVLRQLVHVLLRLPLRILTQLCVLCPRKVASSIPLQCFSRRGVSAASS
ncbi:hypothetical protein ABB37_03354 [Leptomonas pyrrhocoris]|uniref:Uncharacterized protein n=1 Tax=Leptomonas pyrrhocoris TaxID=157538 RepID=A0A0N1J506_LEPPY|nr:hypothetical protein ABB37_03354 [Leptomonas pyrrhocoris]KPA82241.1 hypothetical protein ABB37_03354 [Leptomonas pyrrhocoris]|eukprot:XP_015660680.1 hypothetical protein ABB37_03354 [Leptomonas pyrrhocoris]